MMRLLDVTHGATRLGARAWARHGAGVALLAVFAVLAARLVLAPLHGVASAADCARAYAAARTHGDTVSADLLSYPAPAGRRAARTAAHPASVRRRCGGLRVGTVDLAGRSR